MEAEQDDGVEEESVVLVEGEAAMADVCAAPWTLQTRMMYWAKLMTSKS